MRTTSTLDDYVWGVTLVYPIIQELSQCNLKAVDEAKEFSSQGMNCFFAASALLGTSDYDQEAWIVGGRQISKVVFNLQFSHDDVPFDGYAIVLPPL